MAKKTTKKTETLEDLKNLVPAQKPQELTEVEKFYVQGNKGKSPEELSKDLGRPVVLVKSHLDEVLKNSPKEPSYMQQLMKTTTDERKSKGITVMTPAASEFADEARKTIINKAKNEKYQNCTTKIQN